jgi:hypothetical protein
MSRVLVLVAAPATLSLFAPVAAQDATSDGTESSIIFPDAAECQVEPRSVESIRQLAAAPAGGPMAEPVATPAGTAGDTATVEAVTATVRMIAACFNAGDYPRPLALFSDNFLHSWFTAS